MTEKKSTKTSESTGVGFSDEERAAMKERAQELKKSKRAKKGDGLADVLAKIAEMPDSDRALAEWIHKIVTESAPELEVKTWYGFPAYAKGGKIICFFKPAEKYKSRYCTLGFEDLANLDDGSMWATSYALTAVDEANSTQIAALVKKAAS